MIKKFWVAPLAACALACTVLLSACGGPSVEELIREDLEAQFEEISPEDDELVDAMEASGGAGFEMLGIDSEEYAEAYLDGFAYKIGDITVDEEAGTAKAEVTITMKSMTDILEEFSKQSEEFMANIDPAAYANEQELYVEVGKMLMDVTKSVEPKEATVAFEYEKDGEGVWQPVEGTELQILSAMQ
ncbi:MAG: hypothetical protein Q4B77_00520 [Coriobacteriaceae bacterium]|nr:hypothetical protein [Coriobacteriaceae bacterium]